LTKNMESRCRMVAEEKEKGIGDGFHVNAEKAKVTK
jgi:hypothetical protein